MLTKMVALKVWGKDDDSAEKLALVRLSPEAVRRLLACIAHAGKFAADSPAFQFLVYQDNLPVLVDYQVLSAELAERVESAECIVLDGEPEAVTGRSADGPCPTRLVVLPDGVLWEGSGLETAAIPVTTLWALAGDSTTPATACRSATDDYLAETAVGRKLLDGYEPD